MEDEMIMCVQAEDVEFDEGYTPLEFTNDTASDYYLRLLDSATFKPRSKVESDETYKQIIVYCIITNGSGIYRYARVGGEGRLVGEYSIGIGGHVNISDSMLSDFSRVEAIDQAVRREVSEEVYSTDTDVYDYLLSIPVFNTVGVINDNSNPVGRVHLGVVVLLDIEDMTIINKDENIHQAGFASFEEISDSIEDYEKWSQILIEEYLRSSLWDSTMKTLSIPF